MGRAFRQYLLVACVLALGWGIIEYALQRRSLQLSGSLFAHIVLAWLLCAKVLVLLTPGVVIGASFARFKRAALAGPIIFVIWATVILSWLALDVRINRLYGTHLTQYLRFIAIPGAGDYAGGAGSIIHEVIWTIVAFSGITTLLLLAARALRALARIHPRTLALVVYSAVLAVIPAQIPLGQSRDLLRLHEAQPVRLAWLSPFNNIVDRSSFIEPFAARFDPSLLDSAAFEGKPVDDQAILTAKPLPHVVMVIMESWRFDAMQRAWMPRLDALADQGIRLTNHWSGTIASHWGIFSLLYGRESVLYEDTLSRTIPPQLVHTLKKSGYATTFITSGSPASWSGMDRYINGVFDHVHVQSAGNWNYRDHVSLRQVRQILKDPRQRQFVVTYLLSSHFPYIYPPEHEHHKPVANAAETSVLSYAPRDREGLFNRYANSMSFLDTELSSFVGDIDRSSTLIVIVGDHGESIWDDGSLSHFSKPSEIQSRTSAILLAPHLEPRRVDKITRHCDIAPTIFNLIEGKELPVKHMHGRDVRSDYLPDHALIYTGEGHRSSGYQLTLMTPDGGLGVWVDRKRHRVEAIGRVDNSGDLDRFSFPPQTDLDRWAAMLCADLERLRN